MQSFLKYSFLFFLLSGCTSEPWNSPYAQGDAAQSVLFSSFSSPPKHLDSVVSYNSNEWQFSSQILEPPLQYHYLKQPYTLEPLTLTELPSVRYLNAAGEPVAMAEAVFSEYELNLRPDISYQPHPCFVKNEAGDLDYGHLSVEEVKQITRPGDFRLQSSRLLAANDYVYALKRMADPSKHSPILSTMAQYIVGLNDYSQRLASAADKAKVMQNENIAGVQVLSRTKWRIRIHGVYPQFVYWLAMNFFAPVPWEAEQFYNQAALQQKNLSLDTYPVGTGPYLLAENNPNKQITLRKNPNFRSAFYPSEGLPEGADSALLHDAGKPLPFIDEVRYSLEKESVPLWNKFLQGYYDASGVSSDSFDQAISVGATGGLSLTREMQEKGIQFVNSVQPTIMYFAFNMADPVVGGYSPKQQALRQAISIAINYEEYISIFLNGRGVAAQGPIPPGIAGFVPGQAGINPYVYQWQQGQAVRLPIARAQALLAQAGYPDGKQADGSPLTLYFDTPATGPDSQSMLNWMRKQFAKLGIELVIRATDYNRFQDKVRGAKTQMFSWGWNADYPDPENFLFLLAGENASLHTQGAGVNSANYDNPEFNALFNQIKTLPNGDERQAMIEKMVQLVQQDAPWAFGFHPKGLALYHQWYHNVYPNAMVNNGLKYKRIDSQLRSESQMQWNQPVVWPLWLAAVVLVLSIWPLWRAYAQRQNAIVRTEEQQ